MNTFELKTFKPPKWDAGVFARNYLKYPTENVSLFATQTALKMKKPTGWHST